MLIFVSNCIIIILQENYNCQFFLKCKNIEQTQHGLLKRRGYFEKV